ncbi:MAG: type II toxin-antitoxin system PemK/MazF family toxin [Burkholderiales bacterium]
MPSTTGYSFGDIVLVPFPFTDQSTVKRRPAVVISGDRYNRDRRDLVIMAVTSRARSFGAPADTEVSNWRDAGLLKPSAIKPVIATVAQSLVVHRLGRLSEADQHALRHSLASIIG